MLAFILRKRIGLQMDVLQYQPVRSIPKVRSAKRRGRFRVALVGSTVLDIKAKRKHANLVMGLTYG